MATAQRPPTARRTSRSSNRAATASRGTQKKATSARAGRATPAAEPPQRRQTRATATTATTRRRPARDAAVKESARMAEAEAPRGDGRVVRWTAVSVPVVHTRVPVPSVRTAALPAVSGVKALAAQARWAVQVARANLPPADRLLYYGGVGAMALGGVLDWPVAIVAGAGVWVAGRTAERRRVAVPG